MMHRISVAPSGDRFLNNGQPYFYLADTAWSVFSNATPEEWVEYLDYRRAQGFNALQISVLPILHDASDTYTGLQPFEVSGDGSWNFDRPNGQFFENAAAMVSAAVDRGFVPALVVLWGNYVPNTIFTDKDPSKMMPFESVRPFVELVAETFGPFNPIYLISGDTNFGSDLTSRYYLEALETIRARAPEAMTSLHLNPAVRLPDAITQSAALDFYMYQAGHRLEEFHNNSSLAADFLEYPVRRPIVNGEPPYEGHGHGNRYGRFDRFLVRRAFWDSVLSGAKAGFTYGAHGVWSWHHRGAKFTSEFWSKVPFDWRTALRFPGAHDVAFSASLFNRFKIADLDPRPDLRLTDYPEIQVAATADLSRIALYVPYANDIELAVDLSGYRIVAFTLSDRDSVLPEIVCGKRSTVRMIEANSDLLLFAEKQTQ